MSPNLEASAITVNAAHKHFGAVHAVDGVDLQVERGEIVGLIGRNGAGKSTLFKLMLGLERPSAGTILVRGVATDDSHFRTVRRHVGYLPENPALYENLTGLETLQFFGRLKNAAREQCQVLLDELGLGAAASRAVRGYSRGMRQRLGFAQALLGEPQVLFLDEPTSGLDPQATRDFYARLRRMRDAGVTIVISSHVLAELQERVDRLAILANGRLVAMGSVAALRARTRMPLTVELRVAAVDLSMARDALRALPQLELTETPTGLRVRCAEEQRMAVLAASSSLGARLLDIRLREPSLEDMFLGVTDN